MRTVARQLAWGLVGLSADGDCIGLLLYQGQNTFFQMRSEGLCPHEVQLSYFLIGTIDPFPDDGL